MTTLVLVRHGQASFGGRNYDQLSANGERQSALLGEYWRKLGWTFDGVYSGAMVRQRETGRIALTAMSPEHPPPLDDPSFNEYDFDCILRAYLPVIAREHPDLTVDRAQLNAEPKRFQAVFERAVNCWLTERAHGEAPFESWKAFCSRCNEGLRKIAAPGKQRVVVFTSGGVIAAALRETLGVADDMALNLNYRIFNASVHTFRIGRRGMALLGFNNVSHLELADDPALITFR